MNIAARPISGPSDGDLLRGWRSSRGGASPVGNRRKRPDGDRRWERDPLLDETPREARRRVALDLTEGRRCTARLMFGTPCSLLLPCASHPRG